MVFSCHLLDAPVTGGKAWNNCGRHLDPSRVHTDRLTSPGEYDGHACLFVKNVTVAPQLFPFLELWKLTSV